MYPFNNKGKTETKTEPISYVSTNNVVRLRGLPWASTESDVRDFLRSDIEKLKHF